MNYRFIYITSLLTFISVSIIFGQQTFVVDPSSPTSIEDVQSLVRANNQNMTGDITVLLKNGTYELSTPLILEPSDGGTNGFKVIWKAETPGKVFFSGGKKVTNWKRFDGAKNIYKADVGDVDFRQIYVNGIKGIRARTPNRTNDSTFAPYYKVAGVNLTNRTLNVRSGQISNWANLKDVEMVVYAGFYENRYKISSFTTSNITSIISFQSPSRDLGFTKPTNYYKNAAYYFENAYELLDAEGEWYLNKTEQALYYKPRAGEIMSRTEVIIPTLETLVLFNGAYNSEIKNITFDGVVFVHSNWTNPSDRGIIATQAFQPLPFDATGSSSSLIRPPGAVRVNYGNGINFTNNTFTKLGANGLSYFIGCKNCIVDYNIFENISGNGLIVDQYFRRNVRERDLCSGFKITNNTFQKVGQDYTTGIGILANIVQDVVIESNKFSQLPYTAIQVGNQPGGPFDIGIKNILICNNDISNFTNIHNDGGGIYTLAYQPGCVIRENYIHDWDRSKWDPDKIQPSIGIYLDNCGRYMVLDHNVITNYDPNGVRISPIFLQTTTLPDGITLINNKSTDQCVIDGAGPGNKDKGYLAICSPPATPSISLVEGNTITWNKVDGATGYLVWISSEGSGKYTKYIDVKDVNTYTLDIESGHVAVQAYNGNISCRTNDYSNEVILGSTGIDAVFLNDTTLTSFHVSPNPAKDNVTFHFKLNESNLVNLSICDLNGRVLMSVNKTFHAGENEINMKLANTIDRGVYLCKIKTNKYIKTEKLIIQNI